MQASQSDNGIGDQVWQGYVSAVACLLLSLLLLMCILAIAMILLGGQKGGAAPAQPEVPPAAAAEIAPTNPTTQRDAQWALQFPENTVEMRTQDYAMFAQKLGLSERSNSTQWRWSLWCLANSQSQGSQRLAYLRLMSVREMLIQQGILPGNIRVEIRPAGPSSTPASETLVLVSRTPAKKPAVGGTANGSP